MNYADNKDMVLFLHDNFLPITTRYVLSSDFYRMYRYFCLKTKKVALPLKQFRLWFKDTSNPYSLVVGHNMFGNLFYGITPTPEFLAELEKNKIEIRGKYAVDKETLKHEMQIRTQQKEEVG